MQGDLAAGDKVVTDGADRLREGAKVEVIAPAVRPGSPGGFAGAGGLGGPPARQTGAAEAPASAASAVIAGRPSRANPGQSTDGPVTAPQSVLAGTAKPAAPSATAPAASAGSSWIDNLPPEAQDRARAMMGRLPPEEAARVNKIDRKSVV